MGKDSAPMESPSMQGNDSVSLLAGPLVHAFNEALTNHKPAVTKLLARSEDSLLHVMPTMHM